MTTAWVIVTAMRDQVAAYASGRVTAPPGVETGDPKGPGKMVMDLLKAGARIVAGTDSPNGINLHGELAGYVAALYDGHSPEQCLSYGVACGAESTQHLGAGWLDRSRVESLLDDVQVRRVEIPAEV